MSSSKRSPYLLLFPCLSPPSPLHHPPFSFPSARSPTPIRAASDCRAYRAPLVRQCAPPPPPPPTPRPKRGIKSYLVPVSITLSCLIVIDPASRVDPLNFSTDLPWWESIVSARPRWAARLLPRRTSACFEGGEHGVLSCRQMAFSHALAEELSTREKKGRCYLGVGSVKRFCSQPSLNHRHHCQWRKDAFLPRRLI